MCFYIAQYPVRWTAESALHFSSPVHPSWCSFRHQLGFSWKHSSHAAITFPPLSVARYSFIQLSEQGRQWRERKCPNFETVPKGDSNPGSLDCESGSILSLSYCAPHASATVFSSNSFQVHLSRDLCEST